MTTNEKKMWIAEMTEEIKAEFAKDTAGTQRRNTRRIEELTEMTGLVNKTAASKLVKRATLREMVKVDGLKLCKAAASKWEAYWRQMDWLKG